MESQERDFKGVWIPKEIWLDNNLSWMEKLFITEIDSLDNDEGCYASNGYFSEFFCITKSRCSQIISSLKTKGYISVQLIMGENKVQKRVVRILNEGIKNIKGGIKNPKQGIKNIKGGYLENCESNNTLYNNTSNNTSNRFIPPTVKEVQAYCRERNNGIDAEHFIAFYEAKGWMLGKNKMKDWKSAIITWEKRDKKTSVPPPAKVASIWDEEGLR